MEIHIGFTAQSITTQLIENKLVVILDIFRATSTITTALAHGAGAVYPVSSVEEAYRLKNIYPEALLGGEENSDKITGFDLGNSPLEYIPDLVSGRKIILCTTNGTKAICNSSGAKDIYIGSFLNASALVRKILDQNLDIYLACAGTKATYSLEDTCCAGYLIKLLSQWLTPKLSDAALGALALYQAYAENLPFHLSKSRNGQVLQAKGRWADIEYCCLRNKLAAVPIYREGIISVTGVQCPVLSLPTFVNRKP
ncbi:MAG: 2-phosphosulfolactate phosphatase [Bacillota bacterium]|uniref:2-phosphosulfolactate phosphatase n=1 Tax=Thermanaerosceptrum fracticalcis TaxID=1712410 RepID=UPI00068A5BC3|nr:2-phosphosulfolactate phosphatase [Thermanaerosceptrum fracticalcis]